MNIFNDNNISNTNKARRILAYLLILLNNIWYEANSTLAAMEHKNSQLTYYPDQIIEHQEEAGIVDIIKQHTSGAFLDIGSGIDTISYIINNLPMQELANVNLIANDLEGKTLLEIAKRYSDLYFNLGILTQT